MKRVIQLCALLLLVYNASASSNPLPFKTNPVKTYKVADVLDVSAGPGLGAHELMIYLNRSGPDINQTVSFDVDVMIDYIPEHTQTFHFDGPAGYTNWSWAYYCNWIVGTDATVLNVYNVTYY